MKETSASELLMRHRNRSLEDIKTGAPPLSGKSMAVTYLLAMRCPVYKQRDFHLGFDTELENLIGGGKGKGTSGSSARPKVPIRRSGTDCLVVAWKRGNTRGAKGAGHSRHDRCVNRQREEPTGCGGRRQPSLDGTSRVTGDCHARICERLGVKLPGATRRQPATAVPTATQCNKRM